MHAYIDGIFCEAFTGRKYYEHKKVENKDPDLSDSNLKLDLDIVYVVLSFNSPKI